VKLLLVERFMVPPTDDNSLSCGLSNFGDSIDHDGSFLDESEHVGNEHEMFLANIEPAKI
jgi:hypothetical protein